MKKLFFILIISFSSFISFGQEVSLTPETDSEVSRIISEIEKIKSLDVKNLPLKQLCSGITCLNFVKHYPVSINEFGNKEEEKILFKVFIISQSGKFELLETVGEVKWVPIEYSLNLKSNPEWFEDYKYYIKLKPEKRKVILDDLKEIQKKLKE